MIDSIVSFIHFLKKLPPCKRYHNRKLDRKQDAIIRGELNHERKKSNLIDIDKLGENAVKDTYYLNYPDALGEVEKQINESNRAGNSQIRMQRVQNIDTGKMVFDTANGPQPKFTLQIGNEYDPCFNILFITGTHGEESKLWRAGLEAVLQLVYPGELRGSLLKKGRITFDLFSDICGMDNESRGYVARDGKQVNSPLLSRQAARRFGLGDRNSEQGRQSKEAQSVLTRSNHEHYRDVCGELTWLGDHHETNENINRYPDNYFRYQGIMLMAHIYMTDEELHNLNQKRRCLTFSDKIKRIINDWSPLKEAVFREQLLYNHPSLRKLRQIRDRIRELGQRTFEDIHEKALVIFPMLERDFALDESIWTGGEWFTIPGIRLGPDVLAPEGITTESFQQDLVTRLKQTLAAIEAQIMVVGLDYGKGIVK